MTGTFDSVRDLGWYVEKNPEMEELVKTVLILVIQKNKNRNFTKWFDEYYVGEVIEDWDMEDLIDFYDEFHSLDHKWHHKVFCDRSGKILSQFNSLFDGYQTLERTNYIFAKDFITLKKYVPTIVEYLNKYYNLKHGMYNLKTRSCS
jgi:hypothetical protein